MTIYRLAVRHAQLMLFATEAFSTAVHEFCTDVINNG